jgi:hypothetical protein
VVSRCLMRPSAPARQEDKPLISLFLQFGMRAPTDDVSQGAGRVCDGFCVV